MVKLLRSPAPAATPEGSYGRPWAGPNPWWDPQMNDAITDFWHEHYVKDGLCTLCGNQGVVDTRTTAVSPAGVSSGRLNWCICPNGQALRGRPESVVGILERLQWPGAVLPVPAPAFHLILGEHFLDQRYGLPPGTLSLAARLTLESGAWTLLESRIRLRPRPLQR